MFRIYLQPKLFFLMCFLAALFVAFSVDTSFAIEINEVQKLLANDGGDDDYFGWDVSMSEDTAVIGAWGDDELTGAAYVFVRNGDTWTQEAKLTADDGTSLQFFGWDVSVSGDTAVISAYQVAYVFVRNGVIWTQQDKLSTNDCDPFSYFGESVSVFGDTVVIGAPHDSGIASFSGSAFVFVRNNNVWSQQAKLVASDSAPEIFFGESVDVIGDIAVIGAPGDDVFGATPGAAYVFLRNGDTWSQQAKLAASDGASGDAFGNGVSTDGDTALIGAPGDDDNGDISGSVYVFERSGDVWSQQAKLLAHDGAAGDIFGKLVKISGDNAVIGAWGDDDNGDASGSVYVFVRNGGVWSEQVKITASDGAADDHFGLGLGVDGNIAIIGAEGDDDLGDYAGSAYVFNLSTAPIVRCKGFEPPMADFPVRFKKNHAIPLRAKLFDTSGFEVTGSQLESPPFVQMWLTPGVGDTPIDVTADVLPAGQGDSGNQFYYTESGLWQLIMDTKLQTAPGTYEIMMDSGDHSEYLIDPTCITEFVIDE